MQMKRLHNDDTLDDERIVKEARSTTITNDDDDNKEALSTSQQEALEAVRKGYNVFVTGKAGSGKSHLLRRLLQEMEAGGTTQVTASTGSAAYHVGGPTLHNWAGIGLGDRASAEDYAKRIQKWPEKLADWRGTDCLIVDEISMVQLKYFTKLEQIARLLRNPARVFGGIQLVLVGDYFQCPPIVKKDEQRQYLFESPLWKQLHIKCVPLTQNYRQAQDAPFRQLLDHIQVNEMTPEDVATLRSRVRTPEECHGATRLCSRRAAAQAINNSEIEKLPGQTYTYKAVVVKYDANGVPLVEKTDAVSESRFPVDETINLKVGTLVLLCCNMDVAQGLYNGTRGTVVDFRKADNDPRSLVYPFVEFAGGQRVLVTPHSWNQFKKKRLVETLLQVPLIPRYAITIHKSQGLTLDKALVTMDFFDTGLAYVAFSRVRTLQDLYLTNVDVSKILVDSVVVKFARDVGIL